MGSKAKYLRGVFMANKNGYGFVSVDDEDEDVFISPDNTHNAFHMDKVRIKILPVKSGHSREGKIVAIEEHGIDKVVGTYVNNGEYGFVIADNAKITKDIYVTAANSKNALDNQKVVALITSYGDKKHKPEGKIIEILGDRETVGVDISSIAREYDIDEEFPKKVLKQALNVSSKVSRTDIEWRSDLRDLTMVTIDGEDAKDLDDAVSLTVRDGYYYLGVHIADVSNYVQEGSALDKEALKRGTSVYLTGRVIPMLPKELSNGICSLNQGQDRLALSCIMKIDKNGVIQDHEIKESVICVNHRMTYGEVNSIICGGDDTLTKKYFDVIDMLKQMHTLSLMLRQNREKRGAIDFDFPETDVILDNNGHPIDIKAHERNDATRLIEDFMLAANETVAEEYYWRSIPFLYRTHLKPDLEKIDYLSEMVTKYGCYLRIVKDEIHPRQIQEVLRKIKGSPQEASLSVMVLRAMQQAKYTSACDGHFALAAKYYCHFTSPIRRYPDLQIHRIIKEVINGKYDEKRRSHYSSIIDDVAQQCSELERRAQEAERQSVKLKVSEYMKENIGKIFDGVVSSVTSFGAYVQLENTAEGLVHISQIIDDYYIYDEKENALCATNSGRQICIGDKVRVVVSSADTNMRTVDFKFVEN